MGRYVHAPAPTAYEGTRPYLEAGSLPMQERIWTWGHPGEALNPTTEEETQTEQQGHVTTEAGIGAV